MYLTQLGGRAATVQSPTEMYAKHVRMQEKKKLMGNAETVLSKKFIKKMTYRIGI